MRIATRVAWIAAWTIALIFSPSNALAQDGCIADLNDDGVVNGTDLAIVLGGWGPCPVETTFVGGVVRAGGVPVPGATVTTDLGGKTVAGEGGIFLLEIELPSVIETVVLSATAEIDGVSFEGTKTVSPVNVGGSNLVGLIEVSSGGCDAGFGWSGSASGFDDEVLFLGMLDLGDGPSLYAGGRFTTVAGVAVNCVAQFNGDAWVPLGSGIAAPNAGGVPPVVKVMTVFDDGTGPALYVGGQFTRAGGVPVRGIARWDGTSWSSVGDAFYPNENADVRSMVACVLPKIGSVLVVGGSGLGVQGSNGDAAFWTGQGWSPLFIPLYEVEALLVHQGHLYAGGRADNDSAGLYRLVGLTSGGWNWSPCPGLTLPFPSGRVLALASFDDGTGPALYAGGTFSLTSPSGSTCTNIAKWTGEDWAPVGGVGVNGTVRDLQVHDGESGPQLLAGGDFTLAGNAVAFRIARWNGAVFAGLGGGLNARVSAIASGPEQSLLVGGSFTSAGEVPASRFAEWGCTVP